MQHLDNDTRAIIELANRIAHDYELEYVGTEHILLAVAAHGKGVGAEVLRDFHLSEAVLRQSIDQMIRKDMEDTWVFGRLPGSPHFRNVMALAIDEATQLESNEIRSEHLLLALLRETGSKAQRILADRGVTLEKCRNEVLKKISGGDKP